jgi:hypothetical protein
MQAFVNDLSYCHPESFVLLRIDSAKGLFLDSSVSLRMTVWEAFSSKACINRAYFLTRADIPHVGPQYLLILNYQY